MLEVQVKTIQGKMKTISGDELEVLHNRLRGDVIRQGDAEYETARHVWNGSIDKNPALIIRCSGTADVMTTVNFVRKHELAISIRSGGHNVSGASLIDQGLVIDLSHMRSVYVNPEKRTAWVGGGALLGDLDHETTVFGLAAPLGVVSETGVAGLTLHGGVGWQLRKYGMTIDNIISMEIVTADGQCLRVSGESHPDLFWALKGGGGNFGVVTAFEFKLHPMQPRVTMLMPMYALKDAEKVLDACQEYMRKAPDELMVIGSFWSIPPMPEVEEKNQGKPSLTLLGCYSGPEALADEITLPLRSITEPLADLSSQMEWKEAQRLLDADYPEGKFYYWKSIYLNTLNEEVIAIMDKFTRSRPSGETTIDIWFLGGAMHQVGLEETAFYNRKYPFMVAIEANWSESTESEANIQWARALHKELQPFSGKGTYLNFPGYVEEKEVMLRGSYGENLERLKGIKKKYDPDNLFPGLLNIV